MALKLFSLAVSAASAAWMLQGCGGDEKNAAKDAAKKKKKKGEKNPNPPLSEDAKKPPADEKPPPKSVVEPSRKSGRVSDSTSPVVLAETQRGPVREEALNKGYALRQGDLQQNANVVQEHQQIVVDPKPEQPRKQPRVAKRPRQEDHAGKTKLLQQYDRFQRAVNMLKQRKVEAKLALKSVLKSASPDKQKRHKLSKDLAHLKQQLAKVRGSRKQLLATLQRDFGVKDHTHALRELADRVDRMLQRRGAQRNLEQETH